MSRTDKGEPLAASPTWTFFAAVIFALVLRLAVGWGHLLDLGEVSGDSPGLKLALGLMGLGYLACGVVVFAKVKNTASGFFALHCLAQAIHWGGPPMVASHALQSAIWLAYLTISMLGISAILHFTLLFPSPWKLTKRRFTWLFLYLPIVVAGALAVGRLAATGPRAETLQTAFLVLEAAQVTLYGLLATVVIAIRYVRASQSERQATGLRVMLLGAVFGQLPYFVASVMLPSGSQPYALFFLLIPLTITYAILKTGSGDHDRHDRATEEDQLRAQAQAGGGAMPG